MTEGAGSRRPKGTGSLRHIGDDRWQITIKIGGRRLSRVFSARNATDANRTADSVRLDLMAKHGRTFTDDGAMREQRRRWTVERYFNYYFDTWAELNLAATTRRRYRQLSKNQVLPHIGTRPIAEVTPSDLSRLYAALAEPESSVRPGRTLSGLTIWHVHRFIEAVFTFAVDVEADLDLNPARKTRPRVPRCPRRPRAVDVSEVERFLDSARHEIPDHYTSIMIPAHIGTRRGETVALRWSDFDFERGSVTVSRACSRTPEDGTIIKQTKTGKARDIPIDPDTIAELKTHMRSQRERRILLGEAWMGAMNPQDDYVCADYTGEVMNPDHYSHVFRSFATSCGFSHITPHVLRHAWVSQMIALGFDAVTIASMSGHSPDVLLTTYAHAFDARKREAVDALAAARREARAAR
jgi:integrase